MFYLLIGSGVWQIFNGDVVGGIWIGLIAWFLMSSARNEQEEQANSVVIEQDRLGFKIRNIITPMPPMIEHDQLISDVLLDLEVTQLTGSIPVSKGGELLGFITGVDLERIPIEQRGKLVIGEITRSESLRFCSRFDSGRDALHAMDKYGVMQLVVMDDGYVFGIVTREGVTKAVQEFPYTTDISQPTDQM